MNEAQKPERDDRLSEEVDRDQDPIETGDWLDSLQAVIRFSGPERAAFLLRQLVGRAAAEGIPLPGGITTPFRNTIPAQRERRMPGDLFMERRIRWPW